MSIFLLSGQRQQVVEDYEYLYKHLDEQKVSPGQSENNLTFFTAQIHSMNLVLILPLEILGKPMPSPVTDR